MIHLKGKKALITGGSRGIGRATSLLFAQAGCDVAINFLSRKKDAENTRSEIEKTGRECLAFKADISVRSDVEAVVRKVVKQWGKIDILVNNAGIWTYGEMGSLAEDVWTATMKINLDGVFYACNAAVPFMKEKRQGCIIKIFESIVLLRVGWIQRCVLKSSVIPVFGDRSKNPFL